VLSAQPTKPRRREYERIENVVVDESELEYWSDSSCDTESIHSLTSGASESSASHANHHVIHMARSGVEAPERAMGWSSDVDLDSCYPEMTRSAFDDVHDSKQEECESEGSEQCTVEIELSATPPPLDETELEEPRDDIAGISRK